MRISDWIQTCALPIYAFGNAIAAMIGQGICPWHRPNRLIGQRLDIQMDDILALRHSRQTLRQRLGVRLVLAIGIAPLTDILVLVAIDPGAVPPMRGGKRADVVVQALAPSKSGGKGKQVDRRSDSRGGRRIK